MVANAAAVEVSSHHWTHDEPHAGRRVQASHHTRTAGFWGDVIEAEDTHLLTMLEDTWRKCKNVIMVHYTLASLRYQTCQAIDQCVLHPHKSTNVMMRQTTSKSKKMEKCI